MNDVLNSIEKRRTAGSCGNVERGMKAPEGNPIMIAYYHACGVTREKSPSLVSGMDRRHTPWRWTRTEADLERDCGVGVERLLVQHTVPSW